MNDCLGKELLERHVSGNCSEQEKRAIEAHIAGCEQCRRLIQADFPESDDLKDNEQAPANQDGSLTKSMPNASGATLVTRPNERVPASTYEGYQILEELPLGGQAIVYKAIHKATKMKVALKVLPPGLSISAKARRYFEQEVELAASLNHPNIVAIRDSGIAKGQHYFSMEYVHGKPLDQYVGSKQLSFREKIMLFTKVCDAMTHAHQRGVIHRDLKPSNILVDDRGEPHVLDFGLAKAATSWTGTAETEDMPTMTGQIKGTVAYMSPEQAMGRSDLTDVRTDVYSLGVILYLLLTGRFPYDVSGSIAEALDNIQNEDPVRPRQIISRFDSDVEAILLKCLAKDRAERYQSAAELLGDLQRWLDNLPIVAKSISSLYVLRKIVSRHRRTAKIMGLLTVIILAFSYVSYYLYTDNVKRRRSLHKLMEGAAKTTFGNDRQYTFLSFLDAWHNEDGRAEFIADLLGEGSNERAAANFLLSPQVLGQAESNTRPSLPKKSGWFADFVVGENHFKKGNHREALEAYGRSLEAIAGFHRVNGTGGGVWLDRDILLETKLKARLYELSIANEAGQNNSPPAVGGKEK